MGHGGRGRKIFNSYNSGQIFQESQIEDEANPENQDANRVSMLSRLSLLPSRTRTHRAPSRSQHLEQLGPRPGIYIRRPAGCSCLVVAARVPLLRAGGWRR